MQKIYWITSRNSTGFTHAEIEIEIHKGYRMLPPLSGLPNNHVRSRLIREPTHASNINEVALTVQEVRLFDGFEFFEG